MEVHVCMVLLMEMMERCIRHCHGTTGDGTVAPVVREVEIIRDFCYSHGKKHPDRKISGEKSEESLDAFVLFCADHAPGGLKHLVHTRVAA